MVLHLTLYIVQSGHTEKRQKHIHLTKSDTLSSKKTLLYNGFFANQLDNSLIHCKMSRKLKIPVTTGLN